MDATPAPETAQPDLRSVAAAVDRDGMPLPDP
jgi:hypothetical protein